MHDDPTDHDRAVALLSTPEALASVRQALADVEKPVSRIPAEASPLATRAAAAALRGDLTAAACYAAAYALHLANQREWDEARRLLAEAGTAAT